MLCHWLIVKIGVLLTFDLRPGMTRLGFTYFMGDDTVDYIIKAVAMTAKHAWKLLPQVCTSSRQLSLTLFSFFHHCDWEKIWN